MSGLNTAKFFIILFFLNISTINSIKAKANLKMAKSLAKLISSTVNESTEDDKLTFAKIEGIKCSSANCPNPNVCNAAKTACLCAKERANYPEEGEGGMYCMYERKDQLTCFLLECLLNSGIGHIIAGRLGVGIAKIILTFGVPIFCCIYFGITMCCISKAGDAGATLCGVAGIVVGVIYFIGFFILYY